MNAPHTRPLLHARRKLRAENADAVTLLGTVDTLVAIRTERRAFLFGRVEEPLTEDGRVVLRAFGGARLVLDAGDILEAVRLDAPESSLRALADSQRARLGKDGTR